MEPHRILVVDDSLFMRKLVGDLIAEHPRMEVVATAKNGKEAVELVKKHRPDAVTMDIEMPEMNGLDALRVIMRECPVPVVMLSSLTAEGAKETIQALELGAVDFVRKPSGSISLDLYKVKQQLHEKLLMAVTAKITPVGKKQGRPPAGPAPLPASAAEPFGVRPKPGPAEDGPARQPAALPAESRRDQTRPPLPGKPPKRDRAAGDRQIRHIVAIGTSTGGPKALQKVIASLPGDFPAAIVIVQHMPPNFTKSLAQRLDAISRIRVEEAEQGSMLENGLAYIAPGGWHMHVEEAGDGQYRIALSKQEPRSGHRPSVDVLFESLLPLHRLKRHAVVMTGMGSDGAKGMLALREAGAATTIAESEATCVVYGMPRSAVENGAAKTVLPLEEIGPYLSNVVNQG
ncbi:chemotaxis response regulator protein-glutamate methylesterase [Paenibacillus thermoaerophilus]|uniref:Protein-glutamate methylesterase/protein-glutamine glutaminase n=1 Tax=Paenibacillus thermoaerophilus TaxID=1215385 RepID=A0ABW2V0S1_9BACL|nr:chemotaxis response regulator protein-glutamate methylesterase [Paenibacillus thermoaerophilus]TMV13813.1 chemotaxis response regulator protein-glutamate methylesterase [Paenibacillus thermoaerophilus]